MAPLEFNLLRTDQAAESLEELCSLNISLTETEKFESALEDLQLRLSELEEPRLVELTIKTRQLEWCAFIIRGMCAAELRRRYNLRLVGGKGKRDLSGKGIQAQMTRLAESIGVSPTTLITDARISDTFFSSIEDTALAREHTLPREFYVIALSAPDPQKAIKFAGRHACDGRYSREQFRAYVRRLRRDSQLCKQASKAEHSGSLRILVPRAVQTALEEISQWTGKSEAEELAAMILTRHKTLSQRNKRTLRKVEETHNADVAEDENSLQLMLAI
jgi:hypothetical protein